MLPSKVRNGAAGIVLCGYYFREVAATGSCLDLWKYNPHHCEMSNLHPKVRPSSSSEINSERSIFLPLIRIYFLPPPELVPIFVEHVSPLENEITQLADATNLIFDEQKYMWERERSSRDSELYIFR